DGFCFRVGLRLRPGGGEGPLAVSLPALLSYYEAYGQTWERAVWLKARSVGGDLPLGNTITEELTPFMYRRFLDFGMLEELKAMKRRRRGPARGAARRPRAGKTWGGGAPGVA